MITRRIILTEEIEHLSESQSSYQVASGQTETDALELLQASLLPGELLKLARRLDQAKRSGRNVLVGVEFTWGHARKIVYTESEILERE